MFYSFCITNSSETIWTVPQGICATLYSPNLLPLIHPIVCRKILAKAIVHALVVCDTDVSSAAMVCHAAGGLFRGIVARLEGFIEKSGAVTTVTVHRNETNLEKRARRDAERQHEKQRVLIGMWLLSFGPWAMRCSRPLHSPFPIAICKAYPSASNRFRSNGQVSTAVLWQHNLEVAKHKFPALLYRFTYRPHRRQV